MSVLPIPSLRLDSLSDPLRPILSMALVIILCSAAGAKTKLDIAIDNCWELKDNRAAIEACSIVIKSKQSTKQISIAASDQRGYRYFLLENYDSAIADFGRVMKSSYKDKNSAFNLAAAYENRGRLYWNRNPRMLKEAMADFTQVLRFSPANSGVYYLRGLGYRIQEDYESAASDFKQYFKLQKKIDNEWTRKAKDFIADAETKIAETKAKVAAEKVEFERIRMASNGDICKAAYNTTANTWYTGWGTSTAKYVDETKKRKLTMGDCRVALGLPRDPTPEEQMSQSSLCGSALNSKHDEWSYNAPEVTEAKRRNLSVGDCRIALSLPRIPTAEERMGVPELCGHALVTDLRNWSDWGISATEAKKELARRGVTSPGPCRVALGINRPERYIVMTNAEVCGEAFQAGKREFLLSGDAVDEARLRKLDSGDCRVALGLPRKFDPIYDVATGDLCQTALDGFREDWAGDVGSAKNVTEAKRRNLEVGDCRVALGLPKESVDPALEKAARQLLADATEYARSGAKLLDGLQLAKRSVALNGALTTARQSRLKLAYDALDQLLKSDAEFVAFLAARVEKVRLAVEEEKTTRKSALALAKDFAIQYAGRNITAAATVELVPFIDKVSSVLSSNDDVQVTAALEEAQALIAKIELKADFEQYVAQTCSTDATETCKRAQTFIAGLKKIVAGEPEPAPTPPPQPVQAMGKRVALVIGNSEYRNAVVLPNPRNDARAMSSALRNLSFEVIEGEDLDKDGMEDAIRRFATKLNGADVALFFYAGHGMQVNGRNFLIPVDAQLLDSTAIDFETIGTDQIMSYMNSEKRVSIALLDACRDNPLARRFARSLGTTRSTAVGQGLAALTADQSGTVIGFATAPGEVAQDGDGANSPFTTALLKHMTTKGLDVRLMFGQVIEDVVNQTENQQVPWMNTSLRGTGFYFNP